MKRTREQKLWQAPRIQRTSPKSFHSRRGVGLVKRQGRHADVVK